MTNIEFLRPSAEQNEHSLAERFLRSRRMEMSSTFAKGEQRSTVEKLKSNLGRASTVESRSEEGLNGREGRSQDGKYRLSPVKCSTESAILSSTYQPLVDLSKLVDCAPVSLGLSDLNQFRQKESDPYQPRESSVGVKPGNISSFSGHESVRSSLVRESSSASHESGIEPADASDSNTTRKRKVFSIADILDPQFGSKVPRESKRVRLDSSESERMEKFVPDLQSDFPLRLPAVNPIVRGMLERNTGAYLWNFCHAAPSNPGESFSKVEKENTSKCHTHTGLHKYHQTPHQSLFYHHHHHVNHPLSYLMMPGRQLGLLSPSMERFSTSSVDMRSHQEVLSNNPPMEKSFKFPGITDIDEQLRNHNNNNRPPTASPPSRQHIHSTGEHTLTSSSGAYAEPRRPGSTKSTSSDKDQGSVPQLPPKLWPAWVYCTRYSDRPSSGPRTRKPRKKLQKPSTEGSKQTSSSSSSSSVVDDKRPRTAFNQEQLAVLKREFASNQYLTEERRMTLSSTLGLNESQIKIWFQNKRAKLKKSSGIQNRLAMELMAQGLYNHSTHKSSQPKSGITSPSSSSSRSPAAF